MKEMIGVETYASYNALALRTTNLDNSRESIFTPVGNEMLTSISDVESIYKSNFKNFYSYCYTLTLDKEQSYETVQNVFAKLVAKVKQNKVYIDNLEAYIIRSLRNEIFDQNKKKAKSHLHVVTSEEFESENIEGSSENIKECIENLPNSQRVCVVMFYFDNYSVPQIAEQLNVSKSSVKTHLLRARKKMHEHFANIEVDDER